MSASAKSNSGGGKAVDPTGKLMRTAMQRTIPKRDRDEHPPTRVVPHPVSTETTNVNVAPVSHGVGTCDGPDGDMVDPQFVERAFGGALAQINAVEFPGPFMVDPAYADRYGDYYFRVSRVVMTVEKRDPSSPWGWRSVQWASRRVPRPASKGLVWMPMPNRDAHVDVPEDADTQPDGHCAGTDVDRETE